jgi:hypothetical protein
MKKNNCFKSIITIGIFSCISLQSFAFDTWWHAECTRKAMVANGFSADARLATQFSNYLTDVFPAFIVLNEELDKAKINKWRFKSDVSYEYMHFDAVFTAADIEQNWKLLLSNTITVLRKYASSTDIKPGYRLPILFNIIGASLHVVQDFYSHSNWVNLYANQGAGTIPIWYSVDSLERSKMDLYTGAYPDGSVKGKKNHADLNKDCSARELNKQAVEVAERASIDWVKRLMDSVTTVPWGELKAYNIQNNIVMKRFLVKLDATFLTTSSIIPNHFDGKQPAKFVFSPTKDLTKEKNMAAIALHSTLTEYSANMLVAENTFRLPSPYWVGHQGYHITRDIAAGLKLNGKKYK